MTAVEDGFKKRISEQHLNPRVRFVSPSLHYTMLDLPKTRSAFHIFGVYSGDLPRQVEFIKLGEAVMLWRRKTPIDPTLKPWTAPPKVSIPCSKARVRRTPPHTSMFNVLMAWTHWWESQGEKTSL
jgi:hypothetical protein